MQQFTARLDGVSDRDEMLVKFPRSDRIEQLALGVSQRAILGSGPEHH